MRKPARRTRSQALIVIVLALAANDLSAQESPKWTYAPELLQPFWRSNVVHRESVLFVRDNPGEEARGTLLFPVKKVLSVQNSAGVVTYRDRVDYQTKPGAREIVIPVNSRVVTKLPKDLRREAGTQKHRLTHRDGNGEILFGAKLEYHNMQTVVTYVKASDDWPVSMPVFDATALPRTIQKLKSRQPLAIVLLGDSISTGCNSSGWADGAPFQPPYQDLLQEHLEATYDSKVRLTNFAVSGTSTPWGLTMIDKVVEHQPDLVILAFGMNDSAGRTAADYGKNVAAMIAETRKSLPDAEFILVASMLGNRDWTVLKHDVFPKFRDELAKLCEPGVVLADITSVWSEFLNRKKDRDLTGNGVNHPNDFGHRVYAQVLSALLIKTDVTDSVK